MIQQAIDALYEARQDVEFWAWFAPEQEQKQQGLADHLARIDDDIAKLEALLNQPIVTMAD